MWTVRCPRLLLLLLILLTFTANTCTRAQSGFILKSVELHVMPARDVDRGTRLTLTCIANIGHSGTLPPLQFSVYKDYNKHNSVHISQTNTSNEVTFSIPNARASDSGSYQCEVKVNSQYRDSLIVQISVKGLQTPVLSVDKQDVTEGDTVSITCRAEGERGDLFVVIHNGSSKLYQEQSSTSKVQKNLRFDHMGKAELSCSYSIQLGSTVLSSNSSNVVSVVVRELDFKPTIRVFPSEQVIEGETVHILCGLEGSDHGHVSPSLSLSKGLHLFKIPEYQTVVQANDSGRYECIAELRNVFKSVYANLTVKELFSTPILTITPAEVFEGQQFTITCRSQEVALERIGHHDMKYSIYRNDQELGSRNSRHIDTASSRTNGNYTCAARVNDTIKWSYRTPFMAKVLVSKPNISTFGEVILGRPFSIECRSDRGSLPITYTLKQNNMPLEPIRVFKPLQKAIFNTSIHDEKQIREFRCEAQNNGVSSAVMSDALHARVRVPVQKPNLTTIPENIRENDEVNFMCFVKNVTPPIIFTLYRDNRPVSNKTETKHYFSDLRLVQSGSYHCGAWNGAGDEEMSNKILIKVKMARWKEGLIVCVCLLCVFGLAFLFLRCYRAKRVKVTGSNGTGIWSERPSVLDSTEVEANVEYTEVLHLQAADPARVPLRKGTDTFH
ncbi:platelet endothelial cell adhesion molecule isoform X3 [Hemibagrus wyckioides]|uniref:platelet endothelial cell adhesion molecule isoform X3 n=1 Tax=Hemibagrus wyckioides TaxID=337641 RepID=UPI00266B3D92|nr:platelet endothelial cell adhesion molecule isoform X3 [Hemibagrus wyckioides]